MDVSRSELPLEDLFNNLGCRLKIDDQLRDTHHAVGVNDQSVEATSLDSTLSFDEVSTTLEKEIVPSIDELDLRKPVHSGCESLETKTEDGSDKARRFHTLSLEYWERYHQTNDTFDLDKAIQYEQKAVKTVEDYGSVQVDWIYSLGLRFDERFTRSGQVPDLEQSLRCLQRALESTPQDTRLWLSQLHSLGQGLRRRYLLTNERLDIEQAIQCFQRVLDATPSTDPSRAERLHSIGLAFMDHPSRSSKVEDLEQGITYIKQALEATPNDGSHRAAILQSLGLAFREQHIHTLGLQPLEEAIYYYQKALESAQSDERLYGLGVLFQDKFNKIGEIEDLKTSIRYQEKALELMLEEHPDRTLRLEHLALSYENSFESTGNANDRAHSLKLIREAVGCLSSNPLDRINAGHSFIFRLAIEENWTACIDTLEAILQLLPEITPRTSSREALQTTLLGVSDIPALAASIFLKAGTPPLKALQILERGRGVIASHMMDLRSDVSLLKKEYPSLWSQYTKCLEEIASLDLETALTRQAGTLQSYIPRTRQRAQLFQRLDALKAKIRECAGFENFLLPMNEKEILDMAHEGPIVYFNMSEISSEAFILTPAGVEVLDLLNFDKFNAKDQLDLLASGGNLARRDAEIVETGDDVQHPTSDILNELRLLWELMVKRILQKLDIYGSETSTSPLPRIWWVGGGLISLLPIHAAGCHEPGSKENTLSYVISSYSPTLRSLKLVRNQKQVSLKESKPNILVVSMPQTHGGLQDLQVEQETSEIQKHASSLASVTVLTQPGKDVVLEAIKSCTIAHFACHGDADAIEPGKSSLIVGKMQQERLTIEDFDSVLCEQAEIAYLSACSTAENKVYDLTEESIHLASAFQLAGFRHVIATLWGAEDNAAVEIAGSFYKELLHRDPNVGQSVAYALHSAVLNYRARNGNSTEILKWAPFIHMGC